MRRKGQVRSSVLPPEKEMPEAAQKPRAAIYRQRALAARVKRLLKKLPGCALCGLKSARSVKHKGPFGMAEAVPRYKAERNGHFRQPVKLCSDTRPSHPPFRIGRERMGHPDCRNLRRKADLSVAKGDLVMTIKNNSRSLRQAQDRLFDCALARSAKQRGRKNKASASLRVTKNNCQWAVVSKSQNPQSM